jgi:2-polyprenyl-3-methyl-5-hydroxy-6-metoxy-1,4-benzoquinol methylase
MSQSDNEQYWIERHKSLKGKLESVGKIGMTQDWNLAAYERKRERLATLFSDLGVDLRGADALDAGCGVGMMTRLLLDLGARAHGIDVSADAIEQAWELCPEANFTATSLVNFDLKRKYDLVICIDVLYHIVSDTNWSGVLDSFVEHLRPRGVIVIVDQVRPEPTRPSEHVRFRTLAMYDDKLARSGLYSAHLPQHGFAVVYRAP